MIKTHYKKIVTGKGGFSLAELIVYLGILGISAGIFSGVLNTITTTQVSEFSQNELSGQLNFTIQTIQRLVKTSSIVEGDPNIPTSTLVLQMSDSTQNPTLIYLENGRVFVKQGENAPQSITNEKVSVDSLEFKKFSQAGAKDLVQIDVALSQFQPSTGETLSRSLRSAVSRASAVTLDSSILPPSDGLYDVGTWPSLRWRNGAFSGQLKTTELCIADDCKTSWGAVSGVTGTGSQNYLAKWSSAGAITSSIVYDNGTNVGIGAISPGYKLDVQGGQINASGGLCIAGDCKTGWDQVTGSGAWVRSGTVVALATSTDTVGVGTASTDTNYKITTSGGGIKAESTSQPAGYFNSSSGYGIIVNTGSVGIGTGTPASKLDVSGNVSIGTYAGSSGAPTNGMIISGNVGIGTNSPSHKLDISGSYYSRLVSKGNCSGAVTVDWNAGNLQHCTLTGATTFTFSNGQSGASYRLILKQDATGSRTVSWPSDARWSGAAAPTLTTTASKSDYVGFIYNGADSKYDGVSFNANF